MLHSRHAPCSSGKRTCEVQVRLRLIVIVQVIARCRVQSTTKMMLLSVAELYGRGNSRERSL